MLADIFSLSVLKIYEVKTKAHENWGNAKPTKNMPQGRFVIFLKFLLYSPLNGLKYFVVLFCFWHLVFCYQTTPPGLYLLTNTLKYLKKFLLLVHFDSDLSELLANEWIFSPIIGRISPGYSFVHITTFSLILKGFNIRQDFPDLS